MVGEKKCPFFLEQVSFSLGAVENHLKATHASVINTKVNKDLCVVCAISQCACLEIRSSISTVPVQIQMNQTQELLFQDFLLQR